MARMGRPPSRSRLVDGVEGSALAKTRLRALLGTITGELSIDEAAGAIGCNEARVYQLRARMLQEAAEGLELRPTGRQARPRDPRDEELGRLRAELAEAKRALALESARAEVAAAGVTRGPARKARGGSKKRRTAR